MTDTNQTNQPQPIQPVQTPAAAEPTPAVQPTCAEQAQTEEERKRAAEEQRKQIKENIDKIVNGYTGFKNFLNGFSTKTLCGIALASAVILYAGSDCRGNRNLRDMYSDGARQPSGIAVNKNGIQSVFYCETPETLNELKIAAQRKGISIDNLLLQIDKERPYGRISEGEVEKYLSKK